MDEKKYLTVSEFTRILKNNLETSYPVVYLKGEISNFRPSSTGHWYFVLKDEGASIKAIIFKNSQQTILNVLNANGFDTLKDGQEVLVEGRISVYEKNGEYSIIVNSLLPVGIGELTIKFEFLKEKLAKEGLFDPARKKPIPKYPFHIGIVTSPTGAALQDMLNILNRRFSSVRVTVFPTAVQGEEAKYEIVKAINFASYHYMKNTKYKVDVLIIARGGGSIEDLWPFNEEMVAYAIANCPIPVITGIGHEIDFTIADFCADLRAPTPSAAAELVVQRKEEILNAFNAFDLRMQIAMENRLEKLKIRYQRVSIERIFSLFTMIYENCLRDFSYAEEKLYSVFSEKETKLKQKFQFLVEKLDSLSPLKILNRGYSIVLNEKNKVIKSYEEVKLDENLILFLSKGKLGVNVKSKSSEGII